MVHYKEVQIYKKSKVRIPMYLITSGVLSNLSLGAYQLLAMYLASLNAIRSTNCCGAHEDYCKKIAIARSKFRELKCNVEITTQRFEKYVEELRNITVNFCYEDGEIRTVNLFSSIRTEVVGAKRKLIAGFEATDEIVSFLLDETSRDEQYAVYPLKDIFSFRYESTAKLYAFVTAQSVGNWAVSLSQIKDILGYSDDLKTLNSKLFQKSGKFNSAIMDINNHTDYKVCYEKIKNNAFEYGFGVGLCITRKEKCDFGIQADRIKSFVFSKPLSPMAYTIFENYLLHVADTGKLICDIDEGQLGYSFGISNRDNPIETGTFLNAFRELIHLQLIVKIDKRMTDEAGYSGHYDDKSDSREKAEYIKCYNVFSGFELYDDHVIYGYQCTLKCNPEVAKIIYTLAEQISDNTTFRNSKGG